MKKLQRDQVSSIDDFEDLTLFADESFDTEDVDLFEFTSEESSPLTRLKSIILSLDWEINDEILQELADELQNLQTTWQDDKVAETYLQGLEKIGNYIRTKGAYAHPNSIKLLLTFFYNFEKIISSDQITGDQITQLLKGDVRKFRILQYQIKQSETPSVTEPPPQIEPSVPTGTGSAADGDLTKQLIAAILSLDWEVTDESLRQFSRAVTDLQQAVAENKSAMVLIQGLQALSDYIAEERIDAHPESFVLLHSFSEGLKTILHKQDPPISRETVEEILVDQINRLNNLKMAITTQASAPVDEQLISAVVDELSDVSPKDTRQTVSLSFTEPSTTEQITETAQDDITAATDDTDVATEHLEAEIDMFFEMDAMPAMPAMESADVQYPDEILPPDAIQPVDDELADDFIESHLSSRRGLTPALTDVDETSAFTAEEETFALPGQDDLAAELDLLFKDTDEPPVTSPATEATGDSLSFAPAGNEPIAALSDTFKPIESALHDADVADAPAALHADLTAEEDQGLFDIQNELDKFFTDSTAEPALTSTSTGEENENRQQNGLLDVDTDIPPALAGTDEEQGFSEETEIAALASSPLKGIEEKLDFFFGNDGEVASDLSDSFETAADTLDEALALDLNDQDQRLETDATAAMMAAGEQLQQQAADGTDNELEQALDDFFNEPQGPVTVPADDTTVDALTKTLEATIEHQLQATTADIAEVQLATLGALLPAVVRTPSRQNLADALAGISTLKQAELTGDQLPLLQILETVLTLLTRLPGRDGAATEKLINHVYEQLLAGTGKAGDLSATVGRFTGWLLQASSVLPTVPGVAEEENDPEFTYTAKELYFELADLRSHIRNELAQLRHDVLHHK
ncbi:hypothetical protein [Desulfobulbus oligotrophicus]|uniref:Uncharacterized protein n=1 Tax=Desulfobulbus oligotrophicus TaxID=1909699 RepID=A0A7T5VDP2_9BACT|nr:hypothetical protein [Desulfobulbus oligotrophicus]QQG65989.1 hypothetical protein HP555_08980 [Desulfobulbus oligotrophicus]